MRQAHEYVRPCFEFRRPLRYVGQILELGVEIAVVQKEPFDGAVKTTTLSSWSASIFSIISRNSRTKSGPIRLSGGLSNVTREYLGEDLVS